MVLIRIMVYWYGSLTKFQANEEKDAYLLNQKKKAFDIVCTLLLCRNNYLGLASIMQGEHFGSHGFLSVQKGPNTHMVLLVTFLCMSMIVLWKYKWKLINSVLLHNNITFINIEALETHPVAFLSLFEFSFCQLRRNGRSNPLWRCTEDDWKFGLPDFPRDWIALGCPRRAW